MRIKTLTSFFTKGPWGWTLALFGIWTTVGLVFMFPMAMRNTITPLLFFMSMFGWWQWWAATIAIIRFDRWLPYTDKQFGKRLAAHAGFSVIINCAYVLVNGELGYYLGINNWTPISRPLSALDWLLWCWLIYFLILGGVLAYGFYKRYRSSALQNERLERRFVEARLNALRMQLDPHFLFNALNAISSQVEPDPKLARTMIEHLGDLLRLSLENRDKQQVPLSEEIAFLEHYLEIQKIRFGNRLKVEMAIAPEVKHALVPCLILQPLAENAIRHGLSRRGTGGTLSITAAQIDDRLHLCVRDDGVGLPPGWSIETSNGVGLSVTRERIAGYYPDGSSRFTVHPGPGGGTEVEVSFPLHQIEEDANERAA